VGGSVFVLFVDDDAAFADAAARSFESVGTPTVVAFGTMAAFSRAMRLTWLLPM
jgi:ActR/RegA family two-component response regulator